MNEDFDFFTSMDPNVFLSILNYLSYKDFLTIFILNKSANELASHEKNRIIKKLDTEHSIKPAVFEIVCQLPGAVFLNNVNHSVGFNYQKLFIAKVFCLKLKNMHPKKMGMRKLNP